MSRESRGWRHGPHREKGGAWSWISQGIFTMQHLEWREGREGVGYRRTAGRWVGQRGKVQGLHHPSNGRLRSGWAGFRETNEACWGGGER